MLDCHPTHFEDSRGPTPLFRVLAAVPWYCGTVVRKAVGDGDRCCRRSWCAGTFDRELP